MSADIDEIVATLKKNRAEELQLRWSTFSGHRLLDIRAWMLAPLPTLPAKPTRKGLSLRPEVWRELLPLIAAALDGEADEDEGDDEGEAAEARQ